jgi:NtrC-family two-component system response regulator AlgB
VILARGERIELSDLPVELSAGGMTNHVELGGLVSLEALEQEHVRRVVSRTVKLEDAAKVLGIDVATLYRKRKRWSTETPTNAGREPALQENLS